MKNIKLRGIVLKMELTKFYEKFKLKELHIYESEFWIWSLRPVQATIGSGILSLKRECSEFSELNKEEFSDLSEIIKVIERTLNKTFNYDVMNYLMLMMVDKQVHYHIIPRYERTIDFADITWKDLNWPGVPSLDSDVIDSNILYEIQGEIKENLIV